MALGLWNTRLQDRKTSDPDDPFAGQYQSVVLFYAGLEIDLGHERR